MVTSTPSTYLIDNSEIQELLQTVSLYLHIPFCHTRCHYCDFNTYAGMLPLREPYVRELAAAMLRSLERVQSESGRAAEIDPQHEQPAGVAVVSQ